MTLADLKALVVEELTHVGDSNYDLTDTGDGTKFDARVRMMLNIFVQQTLYLYDPSVTISMTGLAGEFVVPCGAMFQVDGLYVDGIPLARRPYYDFPDILNASGVSSGTPTEYTQPRRGSIMFNRPLSSDAVSRTWKASGFRNHATMADEDADVELIESDAITFASFCASKFIAPVMLTEDALARYQATAAFAASGMAAIMAVNTERMTRK